MPGEIVNVTVEEPVVEVVDVVVTYLMGGPQGSPGLDGAFDGSGVTENVNAVAASGATQNLDVSVYGIHDITMNANCTFTFANPASVGQASNFMLILRGAFTPTLPATIVWAGGVPPTYVSPSIYVFITVDGGATWFGNQVGRDYS